MQSKEKDLHLAARGILDIITTELCTWLKTQLVKRYNKEWWEKGVLDRLKSVQDKSRFSNGQWSTIEQLDLLGLLKVFQFNSKILNLSQDKINDIQVMRDIRGRVQAHTPARGLDLFDLIHDIGMIKKFISFFDTSEDLRNQIDLLYDHANQIWIEKVGHSAKFQESQTKDYKKDIYTFKGSLVEEFNSLTPSQESAVNALQKFFQDSQSQCFILKGYAGTGKTFLLGGIVHYLRKNRRNAVLLAPTGRAARVISERHGFNASTIHREIYYLDKLKEYKSQNDSVTYKFYFELKINEIDHGTIFIVDESSMISDVYSEQEFVRFGSGKLLEDLLKYIGFDENDALKKIIFIGDDAQLPPVGMNISPALNRDYLQKQYGIRIDESVLTDVVRQKANNSILNNATQIREMLVLGQYPAFDFQSDNLTTFEIDRNKAVSMYIENKSKSIEPEQIIITYSNAEADDYNKEIREKLFPGIAHITSGDQIIIVKNNYNYDIDLMNGQIGLVLNVEDHDETRSVPIYVKGDNNKKEKKYITLKFRSITAVFKDIWGNEYELNCLILENLLNSNKRTLTSEESKALYIDFCIRHPHLKQGQPLFKENIQSDMFFNALQIKYAYAITCHKAQGGEWKDVIVDFYGRKKLQEENLRWSYTAITRAKEKLYAIDPLHKSILTPVNPAGGLQEEMNTSPKNKNMTTDSPKEIVGRVIKQLLDQVSDVYCTHETSYQLQFAVVKENVTFKIDFYYNKKNLITHFNILSCPSELKPEIELNLKILIGKNLSSIKPHGLEKESYTLDFFGGIDALYKFHNEINKTIVKHNIIIINVKYHTPYHVEYNFDSDEYGNQSLNYFFNKVGTMTSVEPKGMPNSKTTSFIKLLHETEFTT